MRTIILIRLKMRYITTFFIVTILCFTLQWKAFAQENCVNPNPGGCGSVGQCSTIELNQPQNANCTNIDYSAGQSITFKPGFHYKAVPGKRLHAWIEKPILNESYTPFFEDQEFNEREINTSLPVGTIAGNASVNATGAATYSIPIYIPPGTAGMQPAISLEYNSQSGNGIAGYGWNLAVISAISRVQKSIYHDASFPYTSQSTYSIRFSNDDVFALDGNRLVPCQTSISSSCTTNATACSSPAYYTEIETYSRVTRNGIQGNGPEWFSVETKDGLTIEYGRTIDSRVVAPAPNTPGILVWNINKVIDTYGNYMLYHYKKFSNEAGIVQTLLDRIEYTGNATTSPYNTIKFQYGIRNDQSFAYVAGSNFLQMFLLREIQVLTEEELTKKYLLNYSNNGQYSFLTEIKETGLNNSELNSTRFQYPAGNISGTAFPYSNTPSNMTTLTGHSFKADINTADYNGDGKADIAAFTYTTENGVRIYDPSFRLYINTDGVNFNQPVFIPIPAGFLPFDLNMDPNHSELGVSIGPRGTETNMFFGYKKDTPIPGIIGSDFNGDGLADLLLRTLSGGQYRYVPYLSTGNGFTAAGSIGTALHDLNHSVTIGDFNGDKISDVFIFDNAEKFWYVYFFKSDGTFDEAADDVISASFISIHELQGLFFMPVDFNGDGKTELLSFKTIFQEAIVFETQGLIGSLQLKEIYFGAFPNGNVLFNEYRIYPGDFNGDGITDILTPGGSSEWQIGYGKGNGYDIRNQPTLGLDLASSIQKKKLHISDFNGDGKDDILELDSLPFASGTTTVTYNFYFSKGAGFIKKYFSKTYNNNISEYERYYLGDFKGDGGIEFLLKESNNNFTIINPNAPGTVPFLLSGILNGFNHKTTIEYNFLAAGGNFYTKGSGNTYPLTNFQGPVYVVSKITVPDGIGGAISNSYKYEGATVHLQGKGFLGFSKITTENNATGITSVSDYEILPLFFFPLRKKSLTSSPNGVPLFETSFTNSAKDYTITCPVCSNCDPLVLSKRFFPFTSQRISNDYLRDNTITTDYSYDLNGNLTQQTPNYGGVETETINNTLWVQKGSWIPNRLENQEIVRHRPQDDAAYSIKNHFEYNDNGQVTKSIVFNEAQLIKKLLTDYVYDNITGNLNSVILSTTQPMIESRTTSYEYDSKGRFVTKTTNPLGQVAEANFDARWGKPLMEKSISGLVTTYQYDAFGRMTKMRTPDNIETTYALTWAVGATVEGIGGTPLNGLVYSSVVQRPGSPSVTSWFDIYGREIKTQAEGFNQPVNTVKQFNAKGQLELSSAPFSGNEIPEIKTYFYETTGIKTGLLKTVGSTLDGSITYAYSNPSAGKFKTTVINPAGQSSSQTTDASGKVVSAADDNGTTLDYTYHSHGQLKEVKMGTQTLASMQYDAYARQIKLRDFNAGDINYIYNAYGELEHQDDFNGSFNMEYDKLGRIKQRKNVVDQSVETWDYWESGGGINQIKTITAANGITQNFTYDALGRTTEMKEVIDGEDFITGYQYDAFSHLSKITYPSGFFIDKEYDARGYLKKITNPAATVPLFETVELNSFGQYTKYKQSGILTEKSYNPFGMLATTTAGSFFQIENGWNITTGNLDFRKDHTKNLTEDFGYDNLNRLTSTQVTGNGVPQSPINISYYPNGNIQNKTRIGNYSYNNGLLNAVEKVGNTEGDISGFTQVINYTPFNKTALIKENNKELNLVYGPDQQRRKAVLTENGTEVKTIIYNGNYEKIAAGGNIYEVHYISCGAGLMNLAVKENGGTAQFYNVYTDHLGSILKLTNSNGNVVYEQNFDAWGKERNPSDWNYDNFSDTKPIWLIRGFTGHEHLNEFALINMNGRVYDPLLGRMNSPDNYVQSPFSTQAYNRYSFANNNPLRYVDPDGNSFWDFFKAASQTSSPANPNLNYPDNRILGPNGRPIGPHGMEYNAFGEEGGGNFNIDQPMEPNTFTDASGQTVDIDAMNQEAMERHYAKKYASIINLPTVTIEEARKGKLHKMIQESLDNLDWKNGTSDITDKFMYPNVNIEFNKGRTKGYFNPFSSTIHLPEWLYNKPSSVQRDYIRHEYGHHLQLEQYGLIDYLFLISPVSISSVLFSIDHTKTWTEIEANKFSNEYFMKRFPTNYGAFFNSERYRIK